MMFPCQMDRLFAVFRKQHIESGHLQHVPQQDPVLIVIVHYKNGMRHVASSG